MKTKSHLILSFAGSIILASCNSEDTSPNTESSEGTVSLDTSSQNVNLDKIFSMFDRGDLLKAIHDKELLPEMENEIAMTSYLNALHDTLSSTETLYLVENKKIALELDSNVSKRLDSKMSSPVFQEKLAGDTGQALLGAFMALAEARRSGQGVGGEVAAMNDSLSGSLFVSLEATVESGTKDAVKLALIYDQSPSTFRRIYSGITEFILKGSEDWKRISPPARKIPRITFSDGALAFDGQSVVLPPRIGSLKAVLGKPSKRQGRDNTPGYEYDGINSYEWEDFGISAYESAQYGRVYRIDVDVDKGAGVTIAGLEINASTTKPQIESNQSFNFEDGRFKLKRAEDDLYEVSISMNKDGTKASHLQFNGYLKK